MNFHLTPSRKDVALRALEVVCANQAGNLRLGGVLMATHRFLARAIELVSAWSTAYGNLVAPCLIYLSAAERAWFDDSALGFMVRHASAWCGGEQVEFIASDMTDRLTAASLLGSGPHRWQSLTLHRCRGIDLAVLAPSLIGLVRLSVRSSSMASTRWAASIESALRHLPKTLEAVDVACGFTARSRAGLGVVDALCEFTKLEVVDVSGWPGPAHSAAAVARLGKCCRRIVRLGLAEYGATALAAVDLDQNFPALQSLDVSTSCRGGLPTGYLAAWSTGLAELCLDGRVNCDRRSTRAAAEMTTVPEDGMIARGDRLRSLSIVGAVLCIPLIAGTCLLSLDMSGFQSVAGQHLLVSLAPRLFCLRHLACAASGLQNGHLVATLGALPNVHQLRHLDVSNNPTLDAVIVSQLIRNYCPDLVVLRAFGLGAAAHAAYVPGVLDLNKRRIRRRTRLAARPSKCCAADLQGDRFLLADAYHCFTCLFFGNTVICDYCARTCHVNHKLSFCGRIRMYCDCPTLAQASADHRPAATHDHRRVHT